MYLNDTKKLFQDLYNLPTMYHYMVACAEDGMQDDLSNLISIVECNHDCLHYGDEGSLRWDLEQYETEEQCNQVIKDNRRINWIWKQIKKELKSRYVMCCGCGATFFYTRKPKYDVKKYYCSKCKNDFLSLYTFEEWAIGENIYNDIKKYL